jgi:ribosomal-protein-alanine N-acetyltransferase
LNLIIRRALPEDLASILLLTQASEETPSWSEAVWRDILSEDPLLQRRCFLLGNGECQGFIVVNCTVELAELENVAVRSAARRQGIGRALCLEAIAWAMQLGAAAIQLEVRSKNAGALALYASLGFLEEGRRAGYYSRPVDDAVLMRLTMKDKRAKV